MRERANPPMRKDPRSDKNKFWLFKSRWIICLLCRYLRPKVACGNEAAVQEKRFKRHPPDPDIPIDESARALLLLRSCCCRGENLRTGAFALL